MSNATVKFIFKDKEGNILPIDFDNPTVKKWGDMVVDLLAYQSAGAVLDNGVYALCGRWAFQTNLGWTENWKQVFNVFTQTINDKATTLHGEYADMDLCVDALGFGSFDLDIATGKLIAFDFTDMTVKGFVERYLPHLLPVLNFQGTEEEKIDAQETLEADIMDMADSMIFEGLYHTIS